VVRGEVTLAASSTPGAYLAPGLLREFGSRYPDADAVLQVGDTAQAAALVLEYRAAVGIVGDLAADPALERFEIASDELRLTTAADDMLCRVKPIRREHFADRTLLLREHGSSTRAGAERVLREDVTAFRRVQELGSGEAIKQAVSAGLGVAVLSSWSTRLEEEAGLLRPVRDERYRRARQFYAIRRADRELAGAAKALWELLRKRSSSNPTSDQPTPTT
jgi:DNA-binding transcriptional LysR family regulator